MPQEVTARNTESLEWQANLKIFEEGLIWESPFVVEHPDGLLFKVLKVNETTNKFNGPFSTSSIIDLGMN